MNRLFRKCYKFSFEILLFYFKEEEGDANARYKAY